MNASPSVSGDDFFKRSSKFDTFSTSAIRGVHSGVCFPYAMNLLTHALCSWTRDGVQSENDMLDEYAEKKRPSRFHYFLVSHGRLVIPISRMTLWELYLMFHKDHMLLPVSSLPARERRELEDCHCSLASPNLSGPPSPKSHYGCPVPGNRTPCKGG